jgi:hypothetical protein
VCLVVKKSLGFPLKFLRVASHFVRCRRFAPASAFGGLLLLVAKKWLLKFASISAIRGQKSFVCLVYFVVCRIRSGRYIDGSSRRGTLLQDKVRQSRKPQSESTVFSRSSASVPSRNYRSSKWHQTDFICFNIRGNVCHKKAQKSQEGKRSALLVDLIEIMRT